VAEKVRILRSHGMTSLTWDRHKGHAWSYDVLDLGYNYRIDEIRSALGRVQLRKLARNNELRRERTALYWELLQELCPALGLPFRAHAGLSACHLLPVLLPQGASREAFMEAMKRRGIQTSIHYPPIHHFSAYRALWSASRPGLEQTEAIAAREVTLPLYPALSAAGVLAVVEAARDALAELRGQPAGG
jgi:dTDP-4-amino-4,6-dideoxygalactose transaminase